MRGHVLMGSFLLGVAACSGAPGANHETPSLVTAGEESAGSAPREAAEPAAADGADTEPAPISTVASLPEPFPTPQTLETANAVESNDWGEARYQRVAHPNVLARRQLDDLLSGLAREMLGLYGRCRVRLAHERLVSVRCRGGQEERGGLDGVTLVAHFAIEGGEIEPFRIADAFVGGTSLAELARARCDAARAAIDEGAIPNVWFDEDACAPEHAYPILTPTGVNVMFPPSAWYPGANLAAARLAVDLSYEELRSRIRSDGPLAPVLGGASTGLPRVPEERANAWAVSHFGTQDHVLREWMGLDPAATASLRLERWSGGAVRIVSITPPGESIAGHFGARIQPLELEDPETLVALRWARTTSDLNLRRYPHAGYSYGGESNEIQGTLPRGAIVPAVGGELGQRGTWAATRNSLGPGFVAARYLAALDGCVPTRPDGFASGTLIARVRALQRGRPARDALLFVERRGPRTRIALHGMRADGCAPTDSILAFTVRGRAADVRLTTTHEVGGSTLLVVGVPDRGRANYTVYQLGRRRPVWTHDVARAGESSVTLGERIHDEWFPVLIAIGQGWRRFAWTGRTLESAPNAE